MELMGTNSYVPTYVGKKNTEQLPYGDIKLSNLPTATFLAISETAQCDLSDLHGLGKGCAPAWVSEANAVAHRLLVLLEKHSSR